MVVNIGAPPSRSVYWLAVPLLAAALLLPAVFNGFPLLHPDSGTYLRVALGAGWPIDRSGFYGLMLAPLVAKAGGTAALWLWTALQVTITAAVLLETLRRVAPGCKAARLMMLGAAMVLFTALPWHAGQLMPDAMTGLLVLAAWLALSRSPGAPGAPILWLAVCLFALTHVTHLLILVAIGVVMLGLALAGRVPREEVATRALALFVACLVIAGAQMGANALTLKAPTVSPAGPIFLFARLNEDGHIAPWLDRHCGKDAPADLCAIRHQLPQDSQELLWGPTSDTYFPVPGPGEHDRFSRWMKAFDAANKGAVAQRAPGAGNLAKGRLGPVRYLWDAG